MRKEYPINAMIHDNGGRFVEAITLRYSWELEEKLLGQLRHGDTVTFSPVVERAEDVLGPINDTEQLIIDTIRKAREIQVVADPTEPAPSADKDELTF